MSKYSAEWVKKQVREKSATSLDHHTCSLCGVMVCYIFRPEGQEPEVSFRSACGCSWAPDRPTSWGDISDWLAMQSGDDIREQIWAGLRIPEAA